MKQFKEGDKIRIIRDFKDRGSRRDNAEGVFVEYATENSKYPQAYRTGYRYIVNVPDGKGLVCFDIEHLNMKKYKLKDLRENRMWIRCNNFEQVAKLTDYWKDGDFRSWPIGIHINRDEGIGFNYDRDGRIESYGAPIIDYNEINFEEFVIPEFWYLSYSEDITKKDFDTIISKLIDSGLSPRVHCRLELNYDEFRKSGYLRSYCKGETKDRLGTFCVDNNPQNAETKLFKNTFINNILKTETMEKQLLGYKCPTDLYAGAIKKGSLYVYFTDNSYYCKENGIGQGVVPKEVVETWEKVYENEFKAGDWVVDEEYGIAQIDNIRSGYVYVKNAFSKRGEVNKYGTDSVLAERIRRATKEEIEAATTVRIAGYTAESLNGGVKFGCQEFTLAEIRCYKRLFSSDLRGSLKIAENTITLDMLNKLEALANDR